MVPRDYWVRDAATTQRYRDTLAARLRATAEHRAAAGQRVIYVSHLVPGRLFLDDAHLSPAGNRLVADDFAHVIAAYLPPRR